MAFHKVGLGDPALPSDVNQYAEVFAGESDVGTIRLASPVDAPDTTGVGVPIIGFDLEVGVYRYAMTYVTGIRLTNGNVEVSGETELGPSWEVETTAGNQRVELTSLPLPVGKPTIVAKRLYRTTVGGTEFRLVTTLGPGVSSYIDQTPDDDLGDVAPTENTTGTVIAYTPTGEMTATDIHAAINELQAKLIEERNRNLAIEAEQNVAIWQLEAQVIAAREQMDGWTGEGFFVGQDEVQLRDDAVKVVRGVRQNDGYVEGLIKVGYSDDPVKLPSLPSAPGRAYTVAWNADSTYVAIGFWTQPYLRIYKRIDEIFTEITGFTAPRGPVESIAWGRDPDGTDYLFVTIAVTQGFDWYKRVGDVFTKLADPATTLGASGRAVACTPDGVYVAFGHTSTTYSKYFSWYKRTGDTLIKLADPAQTVDGAQSDAVWSADGQYLFTVGYSIPYFFVFKRSGDTLTRLTTPSVLTESGQRVAINSDATHIAVTQEDTATVFMFSRSGDSITYESSKNIAAGSNVKAIAFSPDDKWFVVGTDTSPYQRLYAYNKMNYTFTLQASQVALGGIPNDVAFSQDATFLLFVHDTSPYNDLFRGNPAADTIPESKLTLKPVSLPTTCNAVYVLDDFVHVAGTGIHRRYEVSLDGGTTWETIQESQIGELVRLNHSGSNMIVRLVMYHDLGDTSKARVYWFAAFATYVA